jgi:ParB family chromosome partitioning protein
MNASPARRRGLGRGLAALLGDEAIATAAAPGDVPANTTAVPQSGAAVVVQESSAPASARTTVATLPVTALRSGRYQPRVRFDDAELADLARSIRTHGLVQPILVRPWRGGEGEPQAAQYEIVAGERRWRAAQKAQLHEVPVVVRSLDDNDALQVALIENVQRTDLTAIEEAHAYRRLMKEFGHTQEDVAESLGKSRPHISNTLRLLDLPEAIQAHVEGGQLSAGHARALIGTPDPGFLAAVAIDKGMSVRQVERLAADCKQALAAGWDGKGLPPGAVTAAPAGRKNGGAKDSRPGAKSADGRALEQRLETALGVRAELKQGKGEASELTLHFKDFDQLDEAVRRLTRS